MMKFVFAFIFCFILSDSSIAQLEKLDQFESRYYRKVEVGMSVGEVKKILGRPKSVESGFPEIRERILSEEPKQVGQLNNSTWFYYYSSINFSYEQPGDIFYYVNGESVTEEIYDQYKNRPEIYIFNDGVLDTLEAKSYLILGNPYLKIVKRDERTEIKKEKPKTITETLIPILCVIFDKGTQVVASTKIYYLRVRG